MYRETVEIYSDRTNAVVLRHPGRKFPGVLVQGDSLYALFRQADEICATGKSALAEDTYEALTGLRDGLLAYLDHYKTVLDEHNLPVPFDKKHSD
jgi:hypothetical protein